MTDAGGFGFIGDLFQGRQFTETTNFVSGRVAEMRFDKHAGRRFSPTLETFGDIALDESVEIIAGGSFDEHDSELNADATAPLPIPVYKVFKGRISNDGYSQEELTAEQLLQKLQAENKQLNNKLQDCEQSNKRLNSELQNCQKTIDRLCAEAFREEDRIEALQAELDEAQNSTCAAQMQLQMVKQQKEELQSRVHQLMQNAQNHEGDYAVVISPLKLSVKQHQGLKDLAVEMAEAACDLSPARRSRSISPGHQPALRPLLARLDADFVARLPSISPPSESGGSVADSCTSLQATAGCATPAEQLSPLAASSACCCGVPDNALPTAFSPVPGSAPASLLAGSVADGGLPTLGIMPAPGPLRCHARERVQGMHEHTASTGSCPATLLLSGPTAATAKVASQDLGVEEDDCCVASLGVHLPALSGSSPPSDHNAGSAAPSTPSSYYESAVRATAAAAADANAAAGEDSSSLSFPHLKTFDMSPMPLGNERPASPFALGRQASWTALPAQAEAALGAAEPSLGPSQSGDSALPRVASPRGPPMNAMLPYPSNPRRSRNGRASEDGHGVEDWGTRAEQAMQAAALLAQAKPTGPPELSYLPAGEAPSPVFPGIDNVQMLAPLQGMPTLAMPTLVAPPHMAVPPRGGSSGREDSNVVPASLPKQGGRPVSLLTDMGMVAQRRPAAPAAEPGFPPGVHGLLGVQPGVCTRSGSASSISRRSDDDVASKQHPGAITICRKSRSFPQRTPGSASSSHGPYSSSQGQYGAFRIDRIDVAPSVQTLPLFPPPPHGASFSLPAYQLGGGLAAQPSPVGSQNLSGSISGGGLAAAKAHRWEGEEDDSDSEL